jgi:hypothetical protein
MQSKVLLVCLALIACVLAQTTPPKMSPQFQAYATAICLLLLLMTLLSVTNTTIETEGRTNVYPGAWWYVGASCWLPWCTVLTNASPGTTLATIAIRLSSSCHL